MMANDDLRIKHELAWTNWWVFPWQSAHQDWKSIDKYAAVDSLCREGIWVTLSAMGIAPCLPPPPTPTLLRLVLASYEQLNLALLLSHCTFNPDTAPALNEDHQLWCMRLSKALPPDIRVPNDDPLQLIRNWVEPAIWHRLRLRLPYERVLETERKHPSFENQCSRLDTLWQAFVWRATTSASDNYSGASEQGG